MRGVDEHSEPTLSVTELNTTIGDVLRDAIPENVWVRGEVQGCGRVLVRMHSRCVYGDVFGSTMCECGSMVRASLRAIAEEGKGVLVYLHQTGPGVREVKDPDGRIRLVSHGRDFMHYKTPDGQRLLQHEIGVGAQILSDLGLRRIRLLTNHPRKLVGLEGYGIEVESQVPLI